MLAILLDQIGDGLRRIQPDLLRTGSEGWETGSIDRCHTLLISTQN